MPIEIKRRAVEKFRTLRPRRASFLVNLGLTMANIYHFYPNMLSVAGDLADSWGKAAANMMPDMIPVSTQTDLLNLGRESNIFLRLLAIRMLENDPLIYNATVVILTLGVLKMLVDSRREKPSHRL